MSTAVEGDPPENAIEHPPAHVVGGGSAIDPATGLLVLQYLVIPVGVEEEHLLTLVIDPEFAEAIGVTATTQLVQEDAE